MTTVVHLHGGGEEGVGEDVTYANEDQDAFQAAGPAQPLAGSTTFGGFAELVGSLDLFPTPPQSPAYRLYRRWAFESAALDLALRQAGRPLHEVVGRDPQPVRFVNSLRLGEPATIDPVRGRLELYPWLEFKLDATSSWTDELVARARRHRRGRVGRPQGPLRGHERRPGPGRGALPARRRRLPERVDRGSGADAGDRGGARSALGPGHMGRADPLDRGSGGARHRPKGVNLKPSRIGSLADLFATYEYCAAQGIRPYGGGQSELGPGRGQIQYLASLFHAASPNDVAPRAFNERELPPGASRRARSSRLRPPPASAGTL